MARDEDVQEILLKVTEIHTDVKTLIKQGDDHEKRIRALEDNRVKPEDYEKHEVRIVCLEQKGGKRWEAAVGAGLAVVVGWVLNQLFYNK